MFRGSWSETLLLRFRGLGFSVRGLRVWCLGVADPIPLFSVKGLGFRVSDLGVLFLGAVELIPKF